jgi:hypothetical protein
MNRFFWAFIALFQLTFGLAQTSARQERPAGNAAALAESLTKGLTSDSLKVNAFFDWITANVGYDVSVFQPGNRINPDLQYTGPRVADGRSRMPGLRQPVLRPVPPRRHSGEIIEGYCRYSLQNPEQLQLHAWNAVKVNGKWYMADLHLGHGLPRPGHRQVRAGGQPGLFPDGPRQVEKHALPVRPAVATLVQPLTKRRIHPHGRSTGQAG